MHTERCGADELQCPLQIDAIHKCSLRVLLKFTHRKCYHRTIIDPKGPLSDTHALWGILLCLTTCALHYCAYLHRAAPWPADTGYRDRGLLVVTFQMKARIWLHSSLSYLETIKVPTPLMR